MSIIHPVAPGYFGIETEDRPPALEVVALIEKAYQEALALNPKRLPSRPKSARRTAAGASHPADFTPA